MTKSGTTLELDFTDSDDQAPGAINATRPSLVNFAMASVLIYLCDGLPWVPGGLWPVVDIVSREGTVVHARWPAGVAMSTSRPARPSGCASTPAWPGCWRLPRSCRPLLMASCQSAGAGACTFSGHRRRRRPFATMTLDDIPAVAGRPAIADGADSSGFTTSPGAACANVEVNESYLPFRYLLRPRAGRLGWPWRLRGGVGTVQVLAPHRVEPDQRALLRSGPSAPRGHRDRRRRTRPPERLRHPRRRRGGP